MESRKSYHKRNGREVKKGWNNLLVSSLILLGVVLVVWVGTNLFIKSFEEASTENSYQKETENKSTQESKDTETANPDEEEVITDEEGNSGEQNAVDADSEETSTSQDDSQLETDGNSSEEVSTIGEWEPIGTEQKEPHVSNYDKGSIDWNEKIKAIEYATKIPKEEMTLLWLGNNGDHNSAFGVITTANEKDNPYIIYMEWVTNKGWKPTKVDRLNDLSIEEQEAIKANYQGETKEDTNHVGE